MEHIATMAQASLQWMQLSMFKQHYELRAGETLVAEMRFRSAWGTLATASSADGCWTFKRVGFWQNKASIRVCEDEADLAIFQNATWSGGGTLTFADSATFKATTNFWNTQLGFQTEADEPLVRFHIGGIFKASAEVEILPAAMVLKELPLLVLFGWYLVVMLQSDSAAVIAAVS